MKPKIIITTGYSEMVRTIRRISDELNLNVTIVEGVLQKAAQEVKKKVAADNYEVIVSRAGTAKEISSLVDLPIVYSDSTYFDLLKGFLEARKVGDKICFITYPEKGYMFDFNEIINVIGFDVTILSYKTQKELVEQVKKAKDLGIEVVVGGGSQASAVARKYGLKTVPLSINERSIKRTLILANKVARDRMLILEEYQTLDTIINASKEGVIFLNKNDKIDFYNNTVEVFFNAGEENLIGKTSKEISGDLSYILGNQQIYKHKGNFTMGNFNIAYKPVTLNKEKIGTAIIIREIKRIQRLETKIRRDLHKKGLTARFTFNNIIYQSKEMGSVVKLAQEYSSVDSTVLITGESGTGKELLAQSIHNESDRNSGPFVAINCSALPESLLESELFGYDEGAFTGASKGGRQGVFELAHEGTIFLDEIGEISNHIQTRLLRVLQEKEVMRIGGDRVKPVNIRIIAATNKNLWNNVIEETFRLDLYFRLSVLHLNIPPLSYRKGDIPPLINHFLDTFDIQQTFNEFSDQLKNFFMTYKWPGNIRQLENVMERYRLRVYHQNLYEQDFINDITNETNLNNIKKTDYDTMIIEEGTMKNIEKQVITKMLKQYNGNKTIVAKQLGMSRTTLWKKLNSD